MNYVVCVSCDVRNRVREHNNAEQPKCGNCGAMLGATSKKCSTRPTWFDRYKYWILLVGIFTTYYAVETFGTPSIESLLRVAGSAQRQSVPPPITPHAAVVPYTQGEYEVFTTEKRIAPLKIRTAAGTDAYYVKLVEAYTGRTAMTLLIRGGQTVETEMPLGDFRLKYASGKAWYGARNLFGPNTEYMEADSIFKFARVGQQISGYTVELVRQRDGNLQTRKVAASRF